jgi:hypothetical protein
MKAFRKSNAAREGASVKRIRVTYKFACQGGHINTGEQVLRVDRKEKVEGEISSNYALWGGCLYCSRPPSLKADSLRILGIEDLPENPFYGCMGYVCPQCGERVTVFRIEANTGIDPPPSITAVCTKGHKRTINVAAEIGSFIHWEEKNS